MLDITEVGDEAVRYCFGLMEVRQPHAQGRLTQLGDMRRCLGDSPKVLHLED